MTIPEREFVNYYIETLDDKKAQKMAHITPYDPELLNRPDINKLVSEKVEEHFSTLDITDEYIISRIKDTYEAASRPVPKTKFDKDGNQLFYYTEDNKPIMERNYNAELKALELLGRYRSLFTDNTSIDLTTDFEKYISNVTDTEEW